MPDNEGLDPRYLEQLLVAMGPQEDPLPENWQSTVTPSGPVGPPQVQQARPWLPGEQEAAEEATRVLDAGRDYAQEDYDQWRSEGGHLPDNVRLFERDSDGENVAQDDYDQWRSEGGHLPDNVRLFEEPGPEVAPQDDGFHRAMRGPAAVEPEPGPDLGPLMDESFPEGEPPEPEFSEYRGPEDALQAPDIQTIESEYRRRQGLSTEQRMLEDAEDDQARGEHLRAKREEMVAADKEAAARNLHDAQQTTQQAQNRTMELLAKAQEVSEREVDMGRWWGSRSGGQQISLGISAMLSGALNPRGKNDTVSMMQDMIGKDIDAQVADMANARAGIGIQKGLVSQLYDQGMSLNEAAETARITAYARMADELAAEAVKFDPLGIHVKNLEKQAETWISKRQQAEFKLGQHNLDMTIKLNEQRRKNAEDVRADEAHSADMFKQGWRQTEGGWERRPRGPKKAKQLSPGEQRALVEAGYLPYLDANGMIIQDPGYEPGETKKGLEVTKVKGDIAGQVARTEKLELEHQKAVEARTVPGLENEDGSDYEAVTDTEAIVLRDMKSSSEHSVSLIDKIQILRHKHGKEMFGSQSGKLMDALFADLTLAKRGAAKTGALDEGSVKIIRESLTGGTKNPSKTLRAFDKAMEGARTEMINGFNRKAKASRRPGTTYKNWEPPRAAPEKSRKKTREERQAGVLQGIPEAFRDDPELRAKAVEQMTADAQWFGDRDKPTTKELRAMGKDLQRQMIEEGLTAEEAIQTAKPFALTLAKQEKEDFEKASVSSLEKKYGSMDKLNRYAKTLKRVLDGDDEAIFDFVIRPGYVE